MRVPRLFRGWRGGDVGLGFEEALDSASFRARVDRRGLGTRLKSVASPVDLRPWRRRIFAGTNGISEVAEIAFGS